MCCGCPSSRGDLDFGFNILIRVGRALAGASLSEISEVSSLIWMAFLYLFCIFVRLFISAALSSGLH